MEYYVYIIKSTLKNWFYVGFTNDLQRRLNEHNLGLTTSTKSYRPYKLVFAQSIENRLEARKLEKHLKVRFNKESIISLIAEVAEW